MSSIVITLNSPFIKTIYAKLKLHVKEHYCWPAKLTTGRVEIRWQGSKAKGWINGRGQDVERTTEGWSRSTWNLQRLSQICL